MSSPDTLEKKERKSKCSLPWVTGHGYVAMMMMDQMNMMMEMVMRLIRKMNMMMMMLVVSSDVSHDNVDDYYYLYANGDVIYILR